MIEKYLEKAHSEPILGVKYACFLDDYLKLYIAQNCLPLKISGMWGQRGELIRPFPSEDPPTALCRALSLALSAVRNMWLLRELRFFE